MKNKISTKFMYVILQLVILTVFVIGVNNDITLETKAEEIDTNLFLTESVNINESSSVFSNLSPRYQELDELQQSEIYGNWQSNYVKFNCYCYAIDYIEGSEIVDGGRHPGQMSGEEFDATLPILHTAELVRNDLLAIGYNDVKIYSTMPTVLYYNQKLICVRQNSSDFHFMKYHPDEDYWTHKPARTMVLKYIAELSNDVVWIREQVNQDGTIILYDENDPYRWREPYNSDIYYITYDVLGFTIDNNGVLTNYTPPSNFNGNLTIPDVTGIGPNVFANLTQLTSITIPNTVTTIGANAFWGCTNLQNINIPASVTQIGDNAFSGCTNLSTIIISSTEDNPSVLTSIGANAFWGCTNLQNINIPASVTQIGAGAFKGCSKLVFNVSADSQHFAVNTSANGNVLYNKALTKIIATGKIPSTVTIHSTVTEIEDYAFYGNTNLRKLRIDDNTSIGAYSFANCENLEEIYFYSFVVPEIEDNAFADSDFMVYVPYGRADEYSESFWYYSSYVQQISIQITLCVQGEQYDTFFVYYGATTTELIEPTLNGKTFENWIDKNGNIYYNGLTWDVKQDTVLYAKFEGLEPIFKYSIILYSYDDAIEPYKNITAWLGRPMPSGTVPQRTGYIFKGYYDQENGNGKQYYDENMESTRNWDKEEDDVMLFAHWEKAPYTITLNLGYNNLTETTTVYYGEQVVISYAPSRQHYKFVGYYSHSNGYGTCYVRGELKFMYNVYYSMEAVSTDETWNQEGGGILYAHWERIAGDVQRQALNFNDSTSVGVDAVYIQSGIEITMTAPSYSNYTFNSWSINGVSYTTSSITVTFELHISSSTGQITVYNPNYIGSASGSDGSIVIFYTYIPPSTDGCVAPGTLITLADGSQVPVETLTGNEMLLVWNLHTGSFDTAPILFIDSDEAREYQIINLYFSDGTHVKVISEHGFWDFDLNRYVYLGSNAGQYVGHWFNKQVTDEDGNLAWTRVQLINVTLTKEYTTAWSPVTYGHLCLYVNGMLSMPGATGGLVNTFEVDGTTMRIDEQSYLADIATYGLYTYEEFAQEYDVPEEIFNAVQGQYLKVAIGKGLIDAQGINALIDSYSQFF